MFSQILDLLTTRSAFFIDLTIEHINLSAIAIIAAIIVGGLLGIFISEYKKFTKPILAIVNFFYTIPSISLLGFLIPFTGIGDTTALIALTIYALMPMVRGVYTGITNVNPQIIEAAVGMGCTEFQLLYRIKIPLAMPVIISGIRSMVTMTIALAGIASFIGAGGLGIAIYRGITTNNSAMIIIGSALIAIIALVFDFMFAQLEKNLYHRRKSNRILRVVMISIIALLGVYFVYNAFSSKKDTIKIATKPVTEEYILGEMLGQLIEHYTDLKVSITHGVGGGTSNIHPAMMKGEFDIYPEYTGTAWNIVLKRDEIYSEDMFREMQNYYEKKLGMKWIAMYGFASNFVMSVRSEIGNKYNTKKISDLSPISSSLRFGAEYDFYERKDGFRPLCKVYDLNFKESVDLDIGLKYKALAAKKIDVMPMFSTDAQLSTADVILLDDDKKFYPSYQCGNIIRLDTTRKYPQVVHAINKITNKINEKEMSQLNHEVEIERKDPKDVAIEFLKSKKLI